MAYDIKIMVKVATLYYKDNITQDNISKKLKISKYQVNRILKRALETGIVKVSISDPTISVAPLEEKLEKRFNLRRAIVVDNYGLSDIELKSKLGFAAANYLMEIIKDADVIGVAWGTTINEVINYLPAKINKNVEVVQVTGGIHQLSVNLNCHDVARRFADRFGVEPHLIYAPAIVDSKELHDLLLNETAIKKTFSYFDKINIAVVGIGALYPKVNSSFIETGHLTESDLKALQANGAIGDVVSHFFDKNGNICDSSIAARLIAISISDLKKVPYCIGVSGGELKAEAILGSIKGKLVNIIITDSKAAEKILKISS